ncbi:uncharacterized protein G2W53_004782 [Senna tora]|uniref:Uncharacterized protein n=1 Tax=Senna tora TaxID=362788 RepID=A0A834XCF4_9FABA|nr:uncharacterized protein G2W53_004782 [Senna tora]
MKPSRIEIETLRLRLVDTGIEIKGGIAQFAVLSKKHDFRRLCDDLRRHDPPASLRRHRPRVPADLLEAERFEARRQSSDLVLDFFDLADSGSVVFRVSLGVISEDVVGMKLLDEEW